MVWNLSRHILDFVLEPIPCYLLGRFALPELVQIAVHGVQNAWRVVVETVIFFEDVFIFFAGVTVVAIFSPSSVLRYLLYSSTANLALLLDQANSRGRVPLLPYPA